MVLCNSELLRILTDTPGKFSIWTCQKFQPNNPQYNRYKPLTSVLCWPWAEGTRTISTVRKPWPLYAIHNGQDSNFELICSRTHQGYFCLSFSWFSPAATHQKKLQGCIM